VPGSMLGSQYIFGNKIEVLFILVFLVMRKTTHVMIELMTYNSVLLEHGLTGIA
jgi:hypothetical protein